MRAHRPWTLLLLLCAANLMAYVAIFSIPPIIGDVARHYGVSYQRAGILMAAYSVVRTLLSLLAGAVSDRYGVQRFVLWGLVLVAVAGYLSSVATSFPLLIFCRVLIGVGATIIFIPGLATAIHLLPPQRVNLASGAFIGSLYLGMSAALLATPILAARASWQFPLKLFAGATVAVGVLFFAMTRRQAFGIPPAAASQPNAEVSPPPGQGYSLRNQALLGAAGVYFLFLFQTYGLITWLPEYLKVVRHYSPPEVGSVSMLLGIVLIPGAILAGFLSDRFGAWNVAVLGSLICAVCPVLLIVYPQLSIGQVSGVVFWKAVGTSMIAVPLAGLLAYLVPARDTGKAVGFVHTAGYAGSIVSTYLGGYLLTAFGNYDWPFGIFSVSMVVNVGVLGLLFRPFQRARAAAQLRKSGPPAAVRA
jgi:predicted MFS family arabinose efflux permease